jgi:Papain-like cysteine protease AvrRpt2
MLKILDDTRIELDLATPALREAASQPLEDQWRRLWRRILERIDCRFHCWRRLPFYMQPQLQSNWCWAANAVSVASFYDSSSQWTQCGLVNAELGKTTCCFVGSSCACDQPWYLQYALARTGNFVRWSDVPTSAEIRSEILNGRPLAAQIAWDEGGAHFVVIAGYRCDVEEYLDIRDPLHGSTDLPLATFSSHYKGNGSWTYAFYTEA